MTTPNPYAISAGDLEKLVREFAEDVCELLLSYPKTAEFARKLKARLASVFSAQMSKEPIVGVLLGPQGAGKSTLLNEMVGETCAPIGYTVTTETINRFQYGSEKQSDKFRVHWRKREHEDLALEDVNETLKDWIAGGKNVSETALIDFFVNSEFLRSHNIALIDTPGIGSTQQHLDAEIQQFLHGEHAATTQHGVIPHVLIYVISDVHPATVRSIRAKFGEYKQTLGILPEASIIVVQSSDGNAERKCELLREEFGSEAPPLLLTHETEALQKQLSYLPDPHLLKVLTVYRIVSNVYEKAVEILKDSVEAEEAHKQGGEKFRDSLKPEIRDSLKSETGITASESRKILQTIVSHLHTLRELRESLESDLQKRQELVENFRKVLAKTREGIRDFPVAVEAFRHAQAELKADWKQEKQRVEDSSHTWKEVFAATPQIVKDLETLETYLKESAWPTIYDVYETSENYLNDLIPSIEERIAQIHQLLESLHQTKAKIEENAHLFEEDIRCLNLLNTLGDSEITNQKKQELQRLFGQNGTSVSRRLRISNGSTSAEKEKKCSELLDYWETERYGASSNELNQILDHATLRLGTIYERL